jgi:hypothetical protein
MSTTKTFVAALSAVALFAATTVSALTVSTGVTGNAHAGAVATTSLGVQVNVGASGSSDTSNSRNTASGDANTSLSVPLVVTRADVNDNNVQATDISAANVGTKSDLTGYIAAKLHADTNLYAVDTASDHVAVTYPERAEFLGFIPVSVETTATADAAGNVSITQPWWSFIAASDNAALQSSVQSNVTGVLGANASATAQLSAAQQARLIAAIESALSASYNVGASASATSQ